MRKFLERVVRVVENVKDMKISTSFEQSIAHTRFKVVEDADRFKFNTAIAALMTLLNTCEAEPAVSKEAVKSFVAMLSPFAPHLAEHLWEKLGGEGACINNRGLPPL